MAVQSACAPAGSSPLTRGKHDSLVADRPAGRLIPAHAGKTSDSLSAGRRPTAHPRSRGENGYSGEGSEAFSGSSPLTRGKLSHGASLL